MPQSKNRKCCNWGLSRTIIIVHLLKKSGADYGMPKLMQSNKNNGYENNSGANNRRVVAAFDFDVTMTTRDTFVPFLYRAFGRNIVRKTFLCLAPEIFKILIGVSDRDRFKQLLVRNLFCGESVERLREEGLKHAAGILKWLRPAALQRIDWHKERGDRLVMVSASLDLYLKPVADALGFNDLICTQLTEMHLVFDGSLSGKNCRGEEKVIRLQKLLGNITDFELYAYGDSVGDREMLAVANHPFYRAFEPKGSLSGV